MTSVTEVFHMTGSSPPNEVAWAEMLPPSGDCANDCLRWTKIIKWLNLFSGVDVPLFEYRFKKCLIFNIERKCNRMPICIILRCKASLNLESTYSQRKCLSPIHEKNIADCIDTVKGLPSSIAQKKYILPKFFRLT